MNLIKVIFDKLNDAAEWVADLIISKPELDKDMQAQEKEIEAGVSAAATYGLAIAAVEGGIAATEALATAGANATLIQGASAFAAAGTEIAAGGTAIASGAAEVAVVGGIILFSGAVAGKVVGRAAGHAYNYFYAEQEEKPEELKTDVKTKLKMD